MHGHGLNERLVGHEAALKRAQPFLGITVGEQVRAEGRREHRPLRARVHSARGHVVVRAERQSRECGGAGATNAAAVREREGLVRLVDNHEAVCVPIRTAMGKRAAERMIVWLGRRVCGRVCMSYVGALVGAFVCGLQVRL